MKFLFVAWHFTNQFCLDYLHVGYNSAISFRDKCKVIKVISPSRAYHLLAVTSQGHIGQCIKNKDRYIWEQNYLIRMTMKPMKFIIHIAWEPKSDSLKNKTKKKNKLVWMGVPVNPSMLFSPRLSSCWGVIVTCTTIHIGRARCEHALSPLKRPLLHHCPEHNLCHLPHGH